MALIYIRNKKRFGANIKKAREKLGFRNVKALEAAIGISDERLGQIEDGEVFCIRSATMEKISNFFNVSPEDLLAEDGALQIAESQAVYSDEVTKKILNLLESLNEEGKRKVLRFTEDQKLLTEFLKKSKA